MAGGFSPLTGSRTDTFSTGIWQRTNHNICCRAYFQTVSFPNPLPLKFHSPKPDLLGNLTNFHTETGERVSTPHWRVSGTFWRSEIMFGSTARHIFTQWFHCSAYFHPRNNVWFNCGAYFHHMMALPHPDQDSSAPLLLLQSVEHLALHFVGGLIQTLGPKYNKKHCKNCIYEAT